MAPGPEGGPAEAWIEEEPPGTSIIQRTADGADEVHACENPKLLTELLREDLGFRGYVVSDWGATHDGKKAAEAGLDVEMPIGEAFEDLDTDQQADRIDQMASRILSSMYASGSPADWPSGRSRKGNDQKDDG